MQPRNLPPVAALAVLDALDELAELAAGLLALAELLALDELLPHAASSRAAAPAAAAVINAVCFTVSSPEPGCRCPAMMGTYPVPGCPKVNSLSRLEGRDSLYCGHLVAEPRPESVT
jgi:hypothetical protein